MQEKGEKSPLSLTNRGIRSTIQQVIGGPGSEGCPLQTEHHRYADVRHKIIPPSGRLDDKKKIIFYL